MIGFVRKGNRAQVKASSLLLISLCLVIISFVFAPDLGGPPEGISPPVGIYLGYQNDLWLPVTFTCDSSLRKISRTVYPAYERTVSVRGAGVFFEAYGYFAANPCGISICLGNFDGVPREDLGQVCCLLDIPPPSNAFSI